MGNSKSRPGNTPAVLPRRNARPDPPPPPQDALVPPRSPRETAVATGSSGNDDTPWVDPKWNGNVDDSSASNHCPSVHDPEPRDTQQLPGDHKELNDPFVSSTLIYADEAADAMRHFIDCALLLPALVPHRVIPLTVAERVVGPFLPGATVEVRDCVEAAAWVTSIPYGLQVPKHSLGDVDVGCLFGAAVAAELTTKVSLTRVLIDHSVNLRDITYENKSGARFLATQDEMSDIIKATAPRLESIGAFACVPKLLGLFVGNGGGTAVRAVHSTCRLTGETGTVLAQRCRATIESVESIASPDFLLELFREPTPCLQRFSWGIVDIPGTAQMTENDVVEVLLAAARAGFFPLLSDVRFTRLSSQYAQPPGAGSSHGLPWYDDSMSAIRAQNAIGVFAKMTEDQSIFQADAAVVFNVQSASAS